jgi:hypothetical protein
MVKVTSTAAAFNRAVLKKLQAAIDEDPETDLVSKIPKRYSDRLGSLKTEPKEAVEPGRDPLVILHQLTDMAQIRKGYGLSPMAQRQPSGPASSLLTFRRPSGPTSSLLTFRRSSTRFQMRPKPSSKKPAWKVPFSRVRTPPHPHC